MTAVGVLSATAAVLLLAAGGWKTRHRRLFRGALRAQGLHAASLLAVLAHGVPAVELVLGMGLLLAPWLSPAIVWPVAAATTGFGAALLAYAVHGLFRFRGKPCGCLSADETFGAWSLVRAALVAGAGPAMLAPVNLMVQLTGLALGLLVLTLPSLTRTTPVRRGVTGGVRRAAGS